jgi:hypothetical protein
MVFRTGLSLAYGKQAISQGFEMMRDDADLASG